MARRTVLNERKPKRTRYIFAENLKEFKLCCAARGLQINVEGIFIDTEDKLLKARGHSKNLIFWRNWLNNPRYPNLLRSITNGDLSSHLSDRQQTR